ncbi:MAG: transposase zinc-binding domain-containing protein, partial [Acidobacteria bacterium]|nr:transposase zinc-binding domain-containing protein [Acidobacteriota bacterium]
MRFAVYRWAHSVMACRTPALGGHEWVCPEGHESRVVWNSCKHRACPQCAGLD